MPARRAGEIDPHSANGHVRWRPEMTPASSKRYAAVVSRQVTSAGICANFRLGVPLQLFTSNRCRRL